MKWANPAYLLAIGLPVRQGKLPCLWCKRLVRNGVASRWSLLRSGLENYVRVGPSIQACQEYRAYESANNYARRITSFAAPEPEAV